MGGPGGVLWSSPQPSAISAALRALAGTYTVAMGRPATARRTWLDSVDRRLYRAGMALTATAGTAGGAETLELSDADGATVTAGPDTAGWPRLLGGLPAELRPRLEPVLGVRALLPMVQVAGSSVAGRLLDAEGKTVLRLVYERPATIAGSRARLPGGLRLIPLRGYATAAVRAGRIVQGAGLVRDDRSRLRGRAGRRRRRSGRHAATAGDPARASRRRGGGQGAAVLPRRDGRRPRRHRRRHRHRVPARLPGRGTAQPLGGQAARRPPPGRPRRVGDAGAEVARRPHRPVPRPRCPPGGAPVHGRRAGQRPARRTWSRWRCTCAGCARASGAGWSAACGRPGTSGGAPAGVPRWRSWRAGTATDRSVVRRSAWIGSPVPIAGCSRRGSRDHARLARRGPARPAQAVQGTALPAGVLRSRTRPGRRAQRDQGAQDRAGRAGQRSRTARRSARRSTRSPPT